MHSEITIREADERDSEDIARVLRLTFAQCKPLYTEQAFAATTPNSDGVIARLREGPIWLASLEERAIGTAGATFELEQCYIRGIAVLPEWRGRGIGLSLLRTIEQIAIQKRTSRLFLTTTPFLDAAISLYTQF